MKDREASEPAVLRWLRRLLPTRGAPTQLPFSPAPVAGSATALDDSTCFNDRQTPQVVPQYKGDLVPGNFLSFPFFLEFNLGGKACKGYPADAFRSPNRVVGAPPTIRWATITDFQLADPPHPTLHWIDDPQRGIGQRKIERIEDLL
jgi:hypothetical protein